MSQGENLVKYTCKDCGLEFWVKDDEFEPRFCPFCEKAILIKEGEE